MQAIGDRGVHPVDDFYPDLFQAWREDVASRAWREDVAPRAGREHFASRAWPQDVAPRTFGYYDIPAADIPLCSECRIRSAQIEARHYDHLDICARCYAKKFVCPICGYDLGVPPSTGTHRG
jgi:hypothetical protein